MTLRTDRWHLAGMCLMLGIFTLGLCSAYLHPEKPERQHDFKVCYAAAAAFQQGLNPYDPAVLSGTMREPVVLPFVYPPHVLYVFRPFTWVDFTTAAQIYLTLKLAAAGLLLWIWVRLFDLHRWRGLLWVLAPLAFNGALLVDLRCGNVSVWEQLFIWTGFYLYARGRIAGFGIAIVLAAGFKLVPILLLSLLAARGKKKELAWGALMGGLFIAGLGASAAIRPDLFAGFLDNARRLGAERGMHNPSSWALINDVVRWIGMTTGKNLPVAVTVIFYAAFTSGVLAVSLGIYSRLNAMEEGRRVLWRICLLCLAYALVVPRFKDYSYILLIAPAFYLFSSWTRLNPLLPLCSLLAVSTCGYFRFWGKALEPLYRVQGEYYCLILAGVLWGITCWWICQGTKTVDDGGQGQRLLR